MGAFSKAIKAGFNIRLALTGPSGSGKTYTALRIATKLAELKGGRIAFIDTERRSSERYADEFDFDVAHLTDYHPRNYIDLIQQVCGDYAVVVIDSLSHAWMGQGGILDLKDRSSEKNGFAAWKNLTPLQNELIDTIIGCDSHVISTMRAKTEYVLEQNSRGKQAPRKVGTAAVQRDGVEYEFDVVGELTAEGDYNLIEFTKTRCPALRGRSYRNPGEDVAQILYDWTKTAAEAPAMADEAVDADNEGTATAEPEQSETRDRFNTLARAAIEAGMWSGRDGAIAWLRRAIGDDTIGSSADCTDDQLNVAIRALDEDLDSFNEGVAAATADANEAAAAYEGSSR